VSGLTIDEHSVIRAAVGISIAGTLLVCCAGPAGKQVFHGPDALDSGSPSASAGDGPTWYADILPLMELHCAGCHQADGIGGCALDTYSAVSLVGDAVSDSVVHRRMPPWLAEDGCHEYRNDLSLGQAQIDTISDWVEAGMPKGDAADAQHSTPLEIGGLDRVDFTLTPSQPYTPRTDVSSDYRCFSIPWPLEYESFVRGLVFRPDRQDLVHHIVAYRLDGSFAQEVADANDSDDIPGFACIGGPGFVTVSNVDWLGSWEPGAVQGMFPNGLGIAVPPDSIVILQVHYTPSASAGGTDLSTVDVQVEDEVETPGMFRALANPSWLHDGGMEIPAHTEGVEHEANWTLPADTQIHAVNLHMHLLGQSAQLSAVDPEGEPDCLLAIDSWNYDWQRFYTLKSPRLIHAGGELNFSCRWDNPTDQDVNWGTNTEDEMCLAKVFVSYP